jgi:hypothetical protein
VSARVCIRLLKDFPVLGKEGTVHVVTKKYADQYLLPEKIAVIVPITTVYEPSGPPSPKIRPMLKLGDLKTGGFEASMRELRLPPMRFFLKTTPDLPIQSVSWEWVEPGRLRLLPQGNIYVKIEYAKHRYLATLEYVQSLASRKVRKPIIVDGSNVGWLSGEPSVSGLFEVYYYIAKRSDQFYFPLLWVFDRSFRRVLKWGEKKIFDEFCRYAGVKVVDYADREVFETAKSLKTPYILSNDRFKEFFTEGYIRISL